MKNQIYIFENRLVHQEHEKKASSGMRDPDDIKREYSEQIQDAYKDTREGIDEVKEQFEKDQMTNMFRSAKVSADSFAQTMISPEGAQNEELEKWREGSDENGLQTMLEEFEKSEDLESAQTFFDQEFGIEGLGSVIKKISVRDRLSEKDYPIIAKLGDGIADIMQLVSEKHLKDPSAKPITFTAEEVEGKSKSLMKNAIFEMVMGQITEREGRKVFDIMIENEIKKIPKEELILVIVQLKDRGLISEQKFLEIIEKYGDLMPELKKYKSIPEGELFARILQDLEQQTSENPDRLPNLNVEIEAPAYSPSAVDANYFAKHASLKNIFLVEYVGRLMTVGAFINIASNFMGGLLAKEERAFYWKRMFTDPNLLLQVGTVAAIYEHVTSEEHGKIFGEGIISEAFGLTEGSAVAKEIAQYIKNPENKYPELDCLFIKKLSENKENYSALLTAFRMDRTSEEIETMRRSLMTPTDLLHEFNPAKTKDEGENLKISLDTRDETGKITLLKEFNPEKSEEEAQKLLIDLNNCGKNITQVLGLKEDFLSEIDTTLTSNPEKQLHLFDLSEYLMQETKDAPYELFKERVYPHFIDEFQGDAYYLTRAKDKTGQGEVMPVI